MATQNKEAEGSALLIPTYETTQIKSLNAYRADGLCWTMYDVPTLAYFPATR